MAKRIDRKFNCIVGNHLPYHISPYWDDTEDTSLCSECLYCGKINVINENGMTKYRSRKAFDKSFEKKAKKDKRI